MLVCPSTGDADFDRVFKMLPASLSTVKLPFLFFFALQLISNLWENTLILCKIPISHKNSPA